MEGDGKADEIRGNGASGRLGSPIRRQSRKILVIIIAIILVGSGTFYIWYNYVRHWSVEDVAEMMINDPDVRSPGFKHSLAGKKVIVEGEVTDIEVLQTNQGRLSLVQLDDFGYIDLMFWGEIDFDLGDSIEVPVRFEWSVCNEESHVYSPQIGAPCLQNLLSLKLVLDSISYIASDSGLFSVSDDDQGVMVSVDILDEPIPLDIVNCSLKAGKHSFAAEYVDALGWYRDHPSVDELLGLSNLIGTNHSIEFTDGNGDGYLDQGDYFLLRGLTRPEMESGAYTYLLSLNCSRTPGMPYGLNDDPAVNLAFVYIIMTKEGVLTIDHREAQPRITPVMSAASSYVEYGQKITITAFTEGVSWSDVVLSFTDGTDFVSVYQNASDLSGGSAITHELGASTLGSLVFFCNITDEAGNGIVDNGDSIVVTTGSESQFNTSKDYFAVLIHKPTSAECFREPITYLVQPSSHISVSDMGSGLRFDLGTVYNTTLAIYRAKMDVMWGEVSITLSDGTDNVTWTPSEGVLMDGAACVEIFDPVVFGGITVFCNLTDLQGNGWINSGDSITLSTGSDATFQDSVTYTLTIVYEPTDGVMSEAEFQG